MKQTTLAITIGLILGTQGVEANPSGGQVVHGSATFSSPSADVLNVYNSHNAIINWQSFNIDAGQTTNFIQPSAASSVLNRVISNNPSQLLGNLNSNGNVYLINQHGILVGQDARINTAGFFASTLNITDEDYLDGNLKFEGGGVGGIENLGYIHAGEGGNVILIAPNIENGGVIEVDNGDVLLAAGKSITISSLENPAIRFEVSGAENSVTNLGEIVAGRGAATLFAGTLEHSGSIRAGGVVQNADGSISLVAKQDIDIADNAELAAADILVQSENGTAMVAGDLSARKTDGMGGNIQLLGEYVGIVGDASIDASGVMGGGQILVGGDYQGANPDVQNAKATFAGVDTTIRADALESGNGGKVILWGDDATRSYGRISATGGALSGDGGFIETSGGFLDLGDFIPDASAANGMSGEWLIDPFNITIQDAADGTESSGWTSPLFTAPVASSILNTETIEAALNAGTSVTVATAASGTGAGNITIIRSIQKTAGTDASLTFNAHNNIIIDSDFFGANIDISSVSGVMDVNFNAANLLNIQIGPTGVGDVTIDTNGGQMSVSGDTNIGGETTFNLNNTTWVIPELNTVTIDTTATTPVWNIGASSTVVNNGVIDLLQGNITGSGTLQNFGSILVNKSTTSTSLLDLANLNFIHRGDIHIASLNTLNLGGGVLDLSAGSILSGFGTLTGNVDVNGGTIFGGAGIGLDSFSSPGSLSITGDLTMNSGLLYTLISAPDGYVASSVNVSGVALINGGTSWVAWGNSGAALSGSPGSLNVIGCLVTACIDPSSTGFDTLIDPLAVTSSTVTVGSGSVVYDFVPDASANIVTWTGQAGDGLWSNGSNWSSGAIPTATDYVFIHDPAGSQQIKLSAGESAAGIQSFEEIELLDGVSPNSGILSVNGDIFILDDAGLTDGQLFLAGANSGIQGSGVLYIGPGAGFNITQGSLSKDVVNWSGVIVGDGASFDLSSQLLNQSILIFGATGTNTITGSGSLTNNGVIDWGGGRIDLNWSGIFDLGTGSKDLSSLTALDVRGGSILNVQDTILPATINLSGGATLSGNGNLDILSTNTVNVNGATLQGLSTGLNVNNQGNINVASGQALILDNVSLSNAASGALSGPGELMISLGSDFSSGGTVDIASIFLDGGTLIANSFDYAGDLIWDSGTVDGGGTGLTTSGDVLLVQGNLNTDWTITPTGTVTWQGSDINSLTIASNATITNQGTFTIESFVDSSVQLRTEAKNLYGLTGAAFINQGTLVIDADAFPGVASADTVVFSLDFTNDNGTIAIKSGTFRIEDGSGVQQDLVLDQAGDSLQGFGTFDGNVVNQAGTVSPGRSDTTNGVFTTGTLTITGDFIQQFDGDLIIKMDSTASGLLNDTLVVQGQLAAGGDVKFAVVNGNTPTQLALLIDQSFVPLEFGTLAGRFDTVDIPPGLNFTFSDTGVISISSDSPLLNNIANQIEALFDNNDLSFAQIIRAMRSIDRGVRAEFGDSDEEGEERAPRLVCR